MRLFSSWVTLTVFIPVLIWLIASLESRNLFQPGITQYPHPGQALQQLALPEAIREVWFTTSDHVKIYGWYVPAQKGKPTVVFAHGNGGNIADRWFMIKPFTQKGYGFLAFDYRGYGESEGTSNEGGLYRDFEAASRYLVSQGVSSTQQIAMGESLGSGVVVDVATRTPFKLVVLFSAYTSTSDVAKHIRTQQMFFPLSILPWENLIHQRFASIEKIHKVTCPIVIMHGAQDTMMPLDMPKTLYTRVSHPQKRLLILPQSGHNTVFLDGVSSLLDAIQDLSDEGPRLSVVKSPKALGP